MISQNETVINRNFTVEVKTPSITAKVLYTTFTYMNNEGNVDCDIDVMGYEGITFMGMPVSEDYKAVGKLRDNLNEMGINLDKILTAEAEKTFNKEYVLKNNAKEIKAIFGK